jgi:phospholipid/cholesterol/gamma-HCH transport system substrate-binding protein
MSRETKIGLLSVIVVALMIWGYMFLKGKNLLSKSDTFYAIFDDVTELSISAPVVLNGFKIGTVTNIQLDKNNVNQMTVTFIVEGDYSIPKNAIAAKKSVGVMGGKAISIEFNAICSGDNCAESGDTLKGKDIGFIGSMLGEEDISKYTSELTLSARSIIANIGKEGEPGSVNETIRQLEIISKNMAALTASANRMVETNSRSIESTLRNVDKISQGLAKNNENIDHIVKNLDKISGDLAKSNIDQTVGKLNTTMDGATSGIAELKTTLQSTTKTLDNLQGILQSVEKGNGTMSRLIYDENLYINLNKTSRELSLLLQDLRLNPKRYAHFSLFGKKQKVYTPAKDDPADSEKK